MSGVTTRAIFNATGKWVLDYPTTPDRVLKAMGKIYELIQTPGMSNAETPSLRTQSRCRIAFISR
jgi:hypothetical protein